MVTGKQDTRSHANDFVLRDWHRFFRQGLQYRHLTRRLYEHLTRHCGFVVRRGKRSFYNAYIEDPDGFPRFLDQFDRSRGCLGAESGSTLWLTGTHADLNSAMVDGVKGMIPAFRDYARRMVERATQAEIEAAERRLAKVQGRAA